MSGRRTSRPPLELWPHEWTVLVPPMSSQERKALVASVREYGIQEPLATTRAGVVLDGRERLNVAAELGLPRVPVRVVDPADPLRYVVESVLRRRHLSAGP